MQRVPSDAERREAKCAAECSTARTAHTRHMHDGTQRTHMLMCCACRRAVLSRVPRLLLGLQLFSTDAPFESYFERAPDLPCWLYDIEISAFDGTLSVSDGWIRFGSVAATNRNKRKYSPSTSWRRLNILWRTRLATDLVPAALHADSTEFHADRIQSDEALAVSIDSQSPDQYLDCSWW